MYSDCTNFLNMYSKISFLINMRVVTIMSFFIIKIKDIAENRKKLSVLPVKCYILFLCLCHFVVLGWYPTIRINSVYSQFHPHSPTIWKFSNSPEKWNCYNFWEAFSKIEKSVRFAFNSCLSPSLCVFWILTTYGHHPENFKKSKPGPHT